MSRRRGWCRLLTSGVTTAPADPAMRGGPGGLGGPFGRGRKEKEGEGEGEKVRKEEKGERLWLAYSPLDHYYRTKHNATIMFVTHVIRTPVISLLQNAQQTGCY